MWDQAPSDDNVRDRVLDFFDNLPNDVDAAFALVELEPHKGRSATETRDALLHGLWEDLEDFWENLEDPSFEGPWRMHLTPLRKVTTSTLGWDVNGDAGEQTVLVNVHCHAGEPTDATAQFSVRRGPKGYALHVDTIHVM